MKEIIKTDQETKRKLNNSFSNIIKNIDIPQYNQAGQIFKNVKEFVIKTIIKDRNHCSIIAIKERCTYSKFSFSFIEKNDIFKKIKDLQINKATQD